ncbi:aldehyde dehydrogenase family protein [Paenibacillus sp. MMS18-CY102]|uniref:aldehyde dehydrogenase family protein n=1 Tax=Paenibacillus sp. MMS18-CY102 TaxID=2682849 RepID=UPI001365BFBD|nr:aldehyde dehydrogenase family protein [Paenibacillus sp. MMS18-CY102]MWC29358.1 aldehyde dehydrogenase family protein [Paenibacillus sp. MMS18-CY102]
MSEKYNKQYINGAWRDGSSKQVYDSVNPYNNEVIAHIKLANRDDIDEAYEAARVAQKAWAKSSADERKQVLRRAAGLLMERKEEIIGLMVKESGSSAVKAGSEFMVAVGSIMSAIEYVDSMFAPHVFPSLIPGKENIVYRYPVGVIGTINAFNFPLYMALRVVAPAVAAGDAVVLKPDSQTFITGGPIIADIFEQAGLPKGIVNVIAYDVAEVGDYMIEHPVPRIMSFTGSTSVGRHIAELCGKHLKRTSLELGGNNAFVVLEDADLDQAVDAAIFSKFMNSGQVCVCTNRFIVHRSLYDAFIERFVERAQQVPHGDPADPKVVIGPLINERQIQKVLGIAAEAKQDGARLVLEGKRIGNVVTPFVFADVDPQSRLAKTEIFGPIASIIPFDTEEEALAMANDTEYGLSGAVFSRDIVKGTAFARAVESGMTHVNDTTINMDMNAPFGGEKSSGIGHYGGEIGFEEFTTCKWVSVQKKPRAFPF